MRNEQPQVLTQEKGTTVYTVAGNEIKLSYPIVKKFLARGNGEITESEITLFISLCKYSQLNPFLNEAYLVKYGTEPATMVVAREAFMKRADSSENYEGTESGLVVLRDGLAIDLIGGCKLPNDKILGAWAKTYRSDRKHDSYVKVDFDEYVQTKKDGTPNRFWKEKPATMIIKVAEAQSLRKAVPSKLGALNLQEEQNIVDSDYEDLSNRETKQDTIKQSDPNTVLPEKFEM